MADPTHVAKLLEGVKSWNLWRQDRPDVTPDLSDLDLSTIDNITQSPLWGRTGPYCPREGVFPEYEQIVLRGIDLRGAFLARVRFVDTAMDFAELEGARFWDACLSKATFQNANAHRAQFTNADLTGARFVNATLTNTSWQSAQCRNAHFGNCRIDNLGAMDADYGFATFNSIKATHVRFWRANFRGANFVRCTFDEVIFTECDFTEAYIEGVVLRSPDLRGSIWRDTYVIGVKVAPRELEGHCYGVAADGIRGDMSFRRLVMDQAYIDAAYIDAFGDPHREAQHWDPPNSNLPPLGWPIGFRTRWPWIAGTIGLIVPLLAKLMELEPSMRHEALLQAVLTQAWAPALVLGAVAMGAGGLFASVRSARGRLSLWRLFDYGRSWKSVAGLAGFSVAFFGFLYAALNGTAIQFSHTGPDVGGLLYPWFVASMGFATLGVSDLVEPLNALGEVVMIANVLSGFTTLGVLLSILGGVFARRS